MLGNICYSHGNRRLECNRVTICTLSEARSPFKFISTFILINTLKSFQMAAHEIFHRQYWHFTYPFIQFTITEPFPVAKFAKKGMPIFAVFFTGMNVGFFSLASSTNIFYLWFDGKIQLKEASVEAMKIFVGREKSNYKSRPIAEQRRTISIGWRKKNHLPAFGLNLLFAYQLSHPLFKSNRTLFCSRDNCMDNIN